MNSRDRRRRRIAAVTVLSLIAASWLSDADFSTLADGDGWQSFTEILVSLGSPDTSSTFLARILRLALESLLIGILGTALAVIAAIGLAIAAAKPTELLDAPGTSHVGSVFRSGIRGFARATLAVFRSVPEIIWAFLFVRIFGLGPGPAVFAIAITFSGIIGKLFAELLETADQEPARLLRASGASRIGAFVYGSLPLVRRQWTGYALFRLECAIRSASILGVVGAGGLGSEIELSIRYFQYDKLATALLAVLAYIIVLEALSWLLRRATPLFSVVVFALGSAYAAFQLPIPWAALVQTDALNQARAFLVGFTNPTTSWVFVTKALGLLAVTVGMAWLATVLAATIAIFLAPLASTRHTLGGYLEDAPRGRGISRWLALLVVVPARLGLQMSRALPELVWALLFIVWVGPGPTAGVLALTIHTIGILGRLYGDALEEAEPEPPRMIEASGASPLARYIHGLFPQALPRMLAFTLFRFEVNVRGAAMVGFVGAGGLGDAMHTAISLFHMSDLATLLGVTFAVVVVIDALGDRLRLRILGST